MFTISMQEPLWGYKILEYIVDLGEKYPWLGRFYPIGADVFVFTYPCFLVVLYLYGIMKNRVRYKESALFIFFSCLFSVLFNILSQQFLDKQRPIYEFGIAKVDHETLLHSFLPSTSFPSDHAVVTFSIAISTFLIGWKYKNKNLKAYAIVLFIFALITGRCRIGTTVHWTTDIIAGMVVGLLIPIVMIHPRIFRVLERYLFKPLIRFEEYLLELLHIKKRK